MAKAKVHVADCVEFMRDRIEDNFIDAIGTEKDETYADIATQRIRHWGLTGDKGVTTRL